MVVFIFIIPFIIYALFRKHLPRDYYLLGLWLIGLYSILSVINAYIYLFPPLALDAESFIQYTSSLVSGNLERRTLLQPFFQSDSLWFFRLCSWFLPQWGLRLSLQSISILAYAITIPLLYLYIDKLKIVKYRIPILLFFSLSPMHMLNRVGAMRESMELLIFMLLLWLILKIIERGISLLYLALIFFLDYMGCRLHYLFSYLTSAFALVVIYVGSYKAMSRYLLSNKNSLIISGLLIISIIILLEPYYFDKIQSLIHDKKNILNIVGKTETVNTEYFSSYSNGVVYHIEMFINYMSYPFPWDVHNLVDFISCILCMVRLILVYYSIKFVFGLRGENKFNSVVILFCCIAIAYIFSMGTGNYGTALRHQILTYWGLVLLGSSGLIDRLKTLFGSKAIFSSDIKEICDEIS